MKAGGARMLRALLRKQLWELGSFLFVDRKTGKGRTKGKRILFLILYAFLFLMLGAVFFSTAMALCGALVEAGLDWLYFALMGMIALALGVFGSVFNTYAGLYNAKDNESLLSMPIPPRDILIARVAGVSLTGMLYEALVMIPAIIARAIVGGFGAAGWVFSILLFFVLALLITTLTCLLGWLVALIAARLKNKSFLTVLVALAFITVYYAVYMQAYKLLAAILENMDALGAAVHTWIYPLYAFGRGAAGSALHFLIFTAIAAALFALEYWVLSRSFVRIVTTKRGETHAEYRERAAKVSGVGAALFRRELWHLTASASYMLNCALGTVLMPVAAAAILIKASSIRGVIDTVLASEMPFLVSALPLFAAVLVCFLTSMNDITAPSVSLEGRSIWLMQSLPVTAWQALRAKLALQIVLTGVPALLLAAAAAFVIRAGAPAAILIAAETLFFVWLMAEVGLALNLKMPNLTWTNEMIPVKQGMPVLIALLSGWLVLPLVVLGFFLLRGVMGCETYLALTTALTAAAALGLGFWLRGRGAAIYASLS